MPDAAVAALEQRHAAEIAALRADHETRMAQLRASLQAETAQRVRGRLLALLARGAPATDPGNGAPRETDE